ncbi:MAG TPA: NAD(P)-binding domain-containing protein, partial [Candidatus Acidoferrales bacterium]
MKVTPTSIAIVGAGRVGRALGRRLRETGWHITSIVTRSESTARRAARYIGAGRPYGKLSRLILETRVVLIAAPDDAVAALAEQLAQIGSEEWKGKIILHTSGGLDSRSLAPLQRFGAIVGSIHPLQSFSSRVAPPLEGVWIVIEG